MGEIHITFGPRILKTGLAVTLSIYICILFGLENFVFAGVAAILAVQPSVYRTWKQLLDQIITNTLGASISSFFIYFFGANPITIGFVITLMIALNIKLKMETTIPLTLVTVLAIMSATGSENFYFALERFVVILIGTCTAIIVNIIIFPPKYKKNFIQDINATFQNMSLLMRTVISNEMKETSYQEIDKKFKKDLSKLEERFKLFEEEREKLGKTKQLNTREIIVFKQMLKVLQEGNQLLDNIDEHYIQSKSLYDESKVFDQQLEDLIKYHEYLLLKYSGKIKEDYNQREGEIVQDKDKFYDQVLEYYQLNKEQKLRNMIIASSIIDYSFHLERLEKLINQYLK
ncbi:aromatic acid exporter family protein [Aquibacillus koreensis]|uniref:Aromatic acid exporter family protein n=1 Tax=Aquibacillus koreensis TaxID=279446 RepID=A0A9X4AIR1_9BACI|nr:aromatic acid exporter family protein [Aquibacillus koreensis]MCT2535140.1 aromatic acid exporter family protein [Aquibacillus koreensis]MDC3420999.1 aromatic acid exporter family protein [Aquibacillus koreensis]